MIFNKYLFILLYFICQLLYFHIPKTHKTTNKVFIMIPQIHTGSTIFMAVKVLLDNGTAEEDITIVSLLVSLAGITEVCARFPKLRVVCGQIECADLVKNLIKYVYPLFNLFFYCLIHDSFSSSSSFFFFLFFFLHPSSFFFFLFVVCFLYDKLLLLK